MRRSSDQVDWLLMTGALQPHSSLDAVQWLAGYLGGLQEKYEDEEEERCSLPSPSRLKSKPPGSWPPKPWPKPLTSFSCKEPWSSGRHFQRICSETCTLPSCSGINSILSIRSTPTRLQWAISVTW